MDELHAEALRADWADTVVVQVELFEFAEVLEGAGVILGLNALTGFNFLRVSFWEF